MDYKKIRSMFDSFQVDISEYDEHYVETSIERLMSGIELSSLDKGKIVSMASYLKNTYTKFFRQELEMKAFSQHLLPRLNTDAPIRIWCAGCSSGEEVYSLSILMEEYMRLTSTCLGYLIIGSDIDDEKLDEARNGKYKYDSVKSVKLDHIKRYFDLDGDLYIIKDSIKNHTWFIHYDLLEEFSFRPDIFSIESFDLVLCSNVLYYYKPMNQSKIINKLIKSLGSESYLITGEAEKSIMLETELIKINEFLNIYKRGI